MESPKPTPEPIKDVQAPAIAEPPVETLAKPPEGAIFSEVPTEDPSSDGPIDKANPHPKVLNLPPPPEEPPKKPAPVAHKPKTTNGPSGPKGPGAAVTLAVVIFVILAALAYIAYTKAK